MENLTNFSGPVPQLCPLENLTMERNLTVDSKDDNLKWIAYQIIGPAIVAIGLLGNVLNLIVLTRPSFKGVTYTYLIGLACSDIGVLLCAVPMMIRQMDQHPKDSMLSSLFYAHMEIPLANTFMASSIFIVICLTADRFAAVCTVSKFKSVHTQRVAKTAISMCYLLGIIISIPLVLLKKTCWIQDSLGEEGTLADRRGGLDTPEQRNYSFTENKDVTDRQIWKAYTIFGEIIVRFGPALLLCVLNLQIIRTFRKVSKKKQEIKQGGDATVVKTKQYLLRGEKISKRIYKEEKRLTVLLLSIVLLFFVTTTPVAFLAITYSETLDKNFPFQVFRALANNLELCNFALNFYIYFLCCKEFRSKFLSFFECIIPRKSEPRNDNFQSVTLPEMSKARENHVYRHNRDLDKGNMENV